jgi:hypothetical protein
VLRSVVLFSTAFVGIWAVVLAYRISFDVLYDPIEEGIAEWVECLFINFAMGIENPAGSPDADVSMIDGAKRPGCGYHFPTRVPTWTTFLVLLTVSTQGFIIFLIFVLRADSMRLWYRFLTTGQRPMRRNHHQAKSSVKGRNSQMELSQYKSKSLRSNSDSLPSIGRVKRGSSARTMKIITGVEKGNDAKQKKMSPSATFAKAAQKIRSTSPRMLGRNLPKELQELPDFESERKSTDFSRNDSFPESIGVEPSLSSQDVNFANANDGGVYEDGKLGNTDQPSPTHHPPSSPRMV